MLSGQGGGGIDEFDNQLNDPNQYDNPQDPASLSVMEHLRALSLRGKLTLVYIVGLLLAMLWFLDWVSLSLSQAGGGVVMCGLIPIFVTASNMQDDSASISESLRGNVWHTLSQRGLDDCALPPSLPPTRSAVTFAAYINSSLAASLASNC